MGPLWHWGCAFQSREHGTSGGRGLASLGQGYQMAQEKGGRSEPGMAPPKRLRPE